MYVVDVGKFWVYQRINEGSFTFQLDPKKWIYRGVQITTRVNIAKRIDRNTRVNREGSDEGVEFHSVIGSCRIFYQFLQL